MWGYNWGGCRVKQNADKSINVSMYINHNWVFFFFDGRKKEFLKNLSTFARASHRYCGKWKKVYIYTRHARLYQSFTAGSNFNFRCIVGSRCLVLPCCIALIELANPKSIRAQFHHYVVFIPPKKESLYF